MKCDTPARALGLVARSRSDPEPERDGADAGNALRDDTLARRELRKGVLRHAGGL